MLQSPTFIAPFRLSPFQAPVRVVVLRLCLRLPAPVPLCVCGLAGSGKSHLARALRDVEVTNGGAAPRVFALDDYFMLHDDDDDEDEHVRVCDLYALCFAPNRRVSLSASCHVSRVSLPVPPVCSPTCNVAQERAAAARRRRGGGKGGGEAAKGGGEARYKYDATQEELYRASMLRAYRKALEEGRFSFIIVEDRNVRVSQFEPFWKAGKCAGFEVYVVQPAASTHPTLCAGRNTHGFSLQQVQDMAGQWEALPPHMLLLDVKSLFHEDTLDDASITEVEMDAEDDELHMEQEEAATAAAEEEEKLKQQQQQQTGQDGAKGASGGAGGEGQSSAEGRWTGEGGGNGAGVKRRRDAGAADAAADDDADADGDGDSDEGDDDDEDDDDEAGGGGGALAGLLAAYGSQKKHKKHKKQGISQGATAGGSKNGVAVRGILKGSNGSGKKKALRWVDSHDPSQDACFTMGAATPPTRASLLIGPGAGYSLATNPVQAEEVEAVSGGASGAGGGFQIVADHAAQQVLWRQQLRAEGEQFRAIMRSHRSQRHGAHDDD
ncbi:unnamed protein product [Closterium sp. NIES-64]|nr:unnamed protein product [Closterium sp. NIES-64]